MQSVIVFAVSLLGGGLTGSLVSVFFNRRFHRRELRTRFYPVLNNMFGAYAIRMQKSEGRYWIGKVGYQPAPEDEEFVEHRASFISDIVEYNELKEVRILRTTMLDNSIDGEHRMGKIFEHDLDPEVKALNECLSTVHKKLKL